MKFGIILISIFSIMYLALTVVLYFIDTERYVNTEELSENKFLKRWRYSEESFELISGGRREKANHILFLTELQDTYFEIEELRGRSDFPKWPISSEWDRKMVLLLTINDKSSSYNEAQYYKDALVKSLNLHKKYFELKKMLSKDSMANIELETKMDDIYEIIRIVNGRKYRLYRTYKKRKPRHLEKKINSVIEYKTHLAPINK